MSLTRILNSVIKRCLFALAAVCWLTIVHPATSFSASQTNFLDLFPEETDSSFFVGVLQADYQENTFSAQRERRAEKDATGYERHFSETRSSSNTFSYSGIKAGMGLKGLPLVYLTAGLAKVDMDFSFSDELTPNKAYYSTVVSLDSDAFPVFGAGVCARIYRAPVFTNNHLNLGLDLNYRYLDFDMSKNTGGRRVDYESQLHEIQLSIAGSIDNVPWNPFSWLDLKFSPFLGFKVSHFIGDETYKDPMNLDRSGNPDPIYYTTDLDVSNHISFFIGTGVQVTESMTMNFETRSGDEDGYALSFICRF